MHPKHRNKLTIATVKVKEKLAASGNALHCYDVYGGNPCGNCRQDMGPSRQEAWCISCTTQLAEQVCARRAEQKNATRRQQRADKVKRVDQLLQSLQGDKEPK